jgi:predicted TIM-barrel fold metal-dependent hydrolase
MTASEEAPMNPTLISADSHVCEPPDLWTRTLGQKYGLTRVPHVAKNGGSGMYGDWTGRLEGDWFVVEGIPAFPMALGTTGGFKGEERARRLRQFDFEKDARRSAWDSSVRLADMDADGVAAEVIYPSYMARMVYMRDAELGRACAAVYNDWVADFCSVDPKRLLPMAVVPVTDARWAAEELHRCLKRGHRGVAIWCTPPPELSFASSHYEPFWSAVADAGVPLALHALPPLDTANVHPYPKTRFVENRTMGLIEDFHMANVTFDHQIQRSITQIVLSGVFERHPKLRVIVAEFGTSWIPIFMDNLDGTYLARPEGLPLKKKPSEYIVEHMWFTFDRELGLTLEATKRLEDRLLWCSDFPHIESSWPDSRQAFARYVQGLDPESQAKLGAKNCLELYGGAGEAPPWVAVNRA